MFITYVVLDPRKPGVFGHPLGAFDYQPAYVGKGKPDRPLDIISFLEGRTNMYSGKLINNWLKSMRSKGYTSVPIITIYKGDEITAFATERILTKHFGIIPEGGILFNLRHGGDDGWSLTPETKALLSELNSGPNNPNFGKKWAAGQHEKWRTTWDSKDRSRSPESMANCWAAMRKKYKITSREGDVYITENLTKFCGEKNLPLSTLRTALKSDDGIAKGKKRESRADGWHVQYIDEKN